MREETGKSVDYYNTRRCHEALGNVTPDYVYYGGKNSILEYRAKLKSKTMARRKWYNVNSPMPEGTKLYDLEEQHLLCQIR